jgi:hypothetical protein
MNAAPIVTNCVRHSAGCKYEGDEFAKRCDCRNISVGVGPLILVLFL